MESDDFDQLPATPGGGATPVQDELGYEENQGGFAADDSDDDASRSDRTSMSPPASPSYSNPASPSESGPTSPGRSAPASPTGSGPASPTDSGPASPTESRPASPTELGPASPTESGPASPTESGPASPTESGPASPTESGPASPTESGPASPTESGPASPSESGPASPTESGPASPSGSGPASPTAYGPASPSAYDPDSPACSGPASPSASGPASQKSLSPPASPSEMTKSVSDDFIENLSAPASPSSVASQSVSAPASPPAHTEYTTAPASPPADVCVDSVTRGGGESLAVSPPASATHRDMSSLAGPLDTAPTPASLLGAACEYDPTAQYGSGRQAAVSLGTLPLDGDGPMSPTVDRPSSAGGEPHLSRSDNVSVQPLDGAAMITEDDGSKDNQQTDESNEPQSLMAGEPKDSTDVGPTSPMNDDQNIQLDDGPKSPMDDGQKSSIDNWSKSSIEIGEKSLTDNAPMSPTADVLMSPIMDEARSPAANDDDGDDDDDSETDTIKPRPSTAGDLSASKAAIQEDADVNDDDSDKESEVGELIADIFGSSDEDEEFEGFGAADVEKHEKEKKKAHAISSDEDEDQDELPDVAEPASEPAETPATQALPDISSDEEIVDKPDKDKNEEFVSDFDLMMTKKKEEMGTRRRRRRDGDIINDNDDIIADLIRKMKEAASDDRKLNEEKKPAIHKLNFLSHIMLQLKKSDLHVAFLDQGILNAVTEWLAPMPDRCLPHLTIRTAMLKQLLDFPPMNTELLKMSGIGKAVMYLYKNPIEVRLNKHMAGKLINEWSRPIFNLTSNYKMLSREEREQRDYEHLPKKRRLTLEGKQDEQQDIDKAMAGDERALRPGDKGWVFRARVPQPSHKDYVVRPKWNVEEMPKGSSKKQLNRYEKHLREFKEKQKQKKAQRAIGISIEGRNMSL